RRSTRCSRFATSTPAAPTTTTAAATARSRRTRRARFTRLAFTYERGGGLEVIISTLVVAFRVITFVRLIADGADDRGRLHDVHRRRGRSDGGMLVRDRVAGLGTRRTLFALRAVG